ncbi:hypothetical protein C8P68_102897 [Mucilaginibacter yixingensis]|uniref:Lycopene cyclase domain-containing protein n=1 Tax=Mucilaginibacter yixingensis TaxID=1295612 RepID=A0A2T5JEI5_9SPHI|nr:hypothetical protein [Mucilaginibacter yixingensis]PTR00066.1 hypothetical protein C8P68_102897 [Mucilaginibacter yixingensis]
MNEYLALAIIDTIFIAWSLLVARVIIHSRSIEISLLWISAYLVLDWCYFNGINKAHQYLRDHKFYIDFGHGSLLLLLDMILCYVAALIIISIALKKRTKKHYNTNTEKTLR